MAVAAKVWPNGEFWAGYPPKPGSKLGLVNLRNSHNSPKGGKGITSHGRRTIRQASFLLFERVSPECVAFLTLTFPGLTIQQCEMVSSDWANVVRRVVQEIRRELRRAGLSGEVVGCTEIQPKRYEETGQPWPHLHLVFQSRRSRQQSWALSVDKMIGIWGRIINDYYPATDSDVGPGVEFERCYSNPSSYLSKYMTKGGDVLEQVRHTYPDWCFPTAWYVCSRSVRRSIAKAVVKLSDRAAASLALMAQRALPPIKVWREIFPEGADHNRAPPLGWVGQVPIEWVKTWRIEGDRIRDRRMKLLKFVDAMEGKRRECQIELAF